MPNRCQFDGGHPENHISFWSLDRLQKIGQDIGFSAVVPAQQNHSAFKPFTNRYVFDTTDPHLSFYTEFVK